MGEDSSDSSDLDESRVVMSRCKRGSSWGQGVGSTSQRGSKRPKGSDQMYVCPLRGQTNSQAGLVTGGVTDISPQRLSPERSGWELGCSTTICFAMGVPTEQAANRVNQECPTPSHNTPFEQLIEDLGKAHQQCNQDGTRQGSRLRLPQVCDIWH